MMSFDSTVMKEEVDTDNSWKKLVYHTTSLWSCWTMVK